MKPFSKLKSSKDFHLELFLQKNPPPPRNLCDFRPYHCIKLVCSFRGSQGQHQHWPRRRRLLYLLVERPRVSGAAQARRGGALGLAAPQLVAAVGEADEQPARAHAQQRHDEVTEPATHGAL